MTLARASAHLVRAYLHPKRDEAAARLGNPLGTNVLREAHWAIRVEAESRRSAVQFHVTDFRRKERIALYRRTI